jgi:hypothetical protein
MEDEKLLSPAESFPQISVPETPKAGLPGVPSPKQQQWGVVISIIVIVLMITIGAFYAWGKRIAEEQALFAPAAEQ